MVAQIIRFVELNSMPIIVLGALALVLYVVARMLQARWPVALTFSTLPAIVFFFHTSNGGTLFAGMF
ncbi:hypothetical protein MXMO3_03311 [Maritalea myrionectae]|uniref:Uncharacterized protein n=1 Tax=Maritalea myrionectae TaxID=454601 RepID=A0A2R4MIU6_9HYPH|nr:hypothetical protein [Maritalea myrionectae]AVX05816.1 hypothetical protein MXMO3_03311 [Maritalea myrionectae]